MLDKILSLIAAILKLNVLETGTDGVWTYKKYGDGTYRAWFNALINFHTGTQWGSGFYWHHTASAYLPPSFSKSVTNLNATANGAQLTWFVGYVITNGNYQLCFVDTAPSTRANVPVNVVIEGKWK